MIKQFAEMGLDNQAKEAECYYAAGLTDSFLIGELNEERISCISVVKHRENEAFGGYLFTYRGQGYGRRMYEFGTGIAAVFTTGTVGDQ